MLTTDETQSQVFQKGLLIISFLFLTGALVVTWNSPATGFEASIYTSTPLVLWIALIFSVAAGISLIIRSASTRDAGTRTLGKYAFLLVFLCYAIGLSVFMIRSYYMWAIIGDPATHIGYIGDILQTGYIAKILFYPSTHIFLSEICLVTNLSPLSLYTIIPFFFSLLCVVFIFLLARVLSDNPVEPVIAGVLGCAYIYGSYLNLTPNGLSNLFLPVALFLIFKYLKSNKFSWAILLSIVLILFPVFHPLPAIMLALILITLWIPHKVRDAWYFVREKNRNFLRTSRINIHVMIPFLILITWFIFWYSFYSIWGTTITEVYQKINAEGGPTKLTDLTYTVNYAQGYGYNIVEIFLKNFGNLVIFSVLTVIAFILLWKTVSGEQKEGHIFSLYGPWAILCIIVPVLYFFNLPFGPLRFISYIFILETVLVAYLITKILIRSRESKSRLLKGLTKAGIVILITGMFLSGLLNLYASPWSMTMTLQSTHAEVAGMEYFLEYRNMSAPISGYGTAVGRFSDLLLGREKRSVERLPQYIKKEDYPPWHFGYDRFSSVADSYDHETYLFVQQSDKSRYIDYFPEMAKYRFSRQDFERLNSDPGASILYSNGDFEFLTIGSKK